MTDIYLTPELKEKYMYDFIENVVECKVDFWKLDDNLVEFLKRINTNQKIQTLYSRRYNLKVYDSRLESYLHFTYTSDVEDKLFKEFIPEITSSYSFDDDSRCYYTFSYPEKNEGDPNNEIGIGYFCMDDYLNVNNIRIHLKTWKIEEHEKFWQEITNRLELI